MSNMGAKLAVCKVFDENDTPIQLGKLWQSCPAILIFLRHFGCSACRGHAQQVWKDRQKYEKGGAKIHFISNGLAIFIESFKEDLGLKDAPVFTDPKLEAFKAAGFRKSFFRVAKPVGLVNGAKMAIDGSHDKSMGHLWQLGGLVVVKQDGAVPYHYISEVLGDYAPDNDADLLTDTLLNLKASR